jgi:hypothetical protein
MNDDFKAFNEMRNEMRETRSNNFKEKWLPIFKENLGDDIKYNDKKGCYEIDFREKGIGRHIILDYYPKANKTLVRHENKWYKPGLKYLIENVFKYF